MKQFLRAAIVVTLAFAMSGCGAPGRSASRAGSGMFEDRNSLEPSPCACVSIPQLAPDADFYARLRHG